jgi:starch-binding outer membrane protein, SusD/RagB family
MKKIIGFSILIISLTSCEGVLDKKPLDQMSDADVWNNSSMVQLFINNLYNAFEVDPNSFWETLSDNAEHTPPDFIHNIQQTNFDKSYDAGWNYSDIRKANLVISNVSASTTIAEKDKDNLIGQAKFFRGFSYFNMILRFGGVVLLDKPLTPDSELKLARNSLADSWAFVINDFKDAATKLENNISEKARLTKGAALLMEARAELYAGEFAEAKTTSESLLALGYDLHPSYNDLFNKLNIYKSSKEVILAVEYKFNVKENWIIMNQTAMAQDASILGWLSANPSQQLVDEYLTIDDDGVARKWDQSNQYFATINNGNVLQAMYKKREPRFYATIAPDSTVFWGIAFRYNVGGNHSFWRTWDEVGALTYHTCKTGYTPAKYMINDLAYKPAVNGSDVHWIQFRYGEAILNYAEALLRLNQLDEARIQINKIRTRGGLPILTSNDNLWQIYESERRKELAMEGHRYWDLLRWRKIDGVSIIPELNVRINAMKISSDLTHYAIVPLTEAQSARHWEARRYLFPIPYNEILQNSNLVQNPGWE